MKVPTSDTGMVISGMIVALQVLQEDEYDNRHEDQGLDERMNDRFDRGLDCGRRVIDDLVVEVGWEQTLGVVPLSHRSFQKP